MYKVILLISLTISVGQAWAQDSLSFLFIGDVMQHGPQITSAYSSTSKTYDYDECYKYLKEEMSNADVTIANLEFTLAGPPYTGYPMFSAPDASAAALKNAGVDILVTANNHTCDRRKDGVIRTLDVLDSMEIAHTGSFRNQEEKESTYPLLIERNGFRIALLNYTYGTNGMPIQSPTIVNLIEEDKMLADIAKAQTMNVDKIIAFLHWGSEYMHAPNQDQKSIAQLLTKNGVDLVIGSHPHVLQPMIYTKMDSSEQLVVYSLGNFVSNQRTVPRDGGAMVKVTLVRNEDRVSINPPGYLLTWVWLPTIQGKKIYYVLPASKYETNRQMMDAASHAKMLAYIKSMRTLLDKENEGVEEYLFTDDAGWSLKE